jgi:cytochrome c
VIKFLSLLAAATTLSGTAFAQQGERVFNQQCKNCHTVEKGGSNDAGPNLFGIFGRKAGTVGNASDAMKASGIVWDDKTMAEYLRDPKARVPDGTMVFNGLKQANQLNDVIAHLKKVTQ